jgi:two-component system sporulation sensor kinase A
MKQFIANLPIQTKIALIVLLVTAFSLITGFGFVILHDIRTFRNDMVENTVAVARIIGDYSVVDIAFRDEEASRDTLSKLSSISNIDAAYLYDASGNLFSSFVKEGVRSQPPSLQSNLTEFSGTHLHVFKPIRRQNEFYGTIYLRSSTEALNAKVRDYLFTMILSLVVLMLLSAAIAFLLQGVISRPILDLAGVAKRISEVGDYSIRAEKKGEDEIGQLCDGFNNMLEQIDRRQVEQNKAETALRESEDRYRGLVESSPDAIFVVQRGSIAFINVAGLKMLGYKSIEELKRESSPTFSKKLLDSAGTSVPFEASFQRKDGTNLELEVTITEILFKGAAATQVMARDVTERTNLRQAAQKMERLAAIGEFAAMIAHEIRNSLGSISLNFKYLTERLDVPEAYRTKFSNIEEGIQRIQEVIKGILEFARPTPSNLKRTSIQQLLDSSCLAVEKEMEESAITVVRTYSGNLPDLMLDSNQIVQVFVNLFLNARAAMTPGGTLKICAKATEKNVVVEVEDTGRGILPEHLPRIYDPFFTTRRDGVGLGLAIVTRTLEQHGAKISAHSVPEQGTCFTVKFPLEIPL